MEKPGSVSCPYIVCKHDHKGRAIRCAYRFLSFFRSFTLKLSSSVFPVSDCDSDTETDLSEKRLQDSVAVSCLQITVPGTRSSSP